MECKGLDGNGCKHNGIKSEIWFVCNDCDNDHREIVKLQNWNMEKAKELARMSMARTSQGLKYGEDMKSSTKICLQDALTLIQRALECLEDIRV